MHISALEVIVFAVVLSFVLFGPKPSFGRKTKKPATLKIKEVERVSYFTSQYPYQPGQAAASLAPSPLKLRAAARPLPAPRQRQFATVDADGQQKLAPLPHELPS